MAVGQQELGSRAWQNESVSCCIEKSLNILIHKILLVSEDFERVSCTFFCKRTQRLAEFLPTRSPKASILRPTGYPRNNSATRGVKATVRARRIGPTASVTARVNCKRTTLEAAFPFICSFNPRKRKIQTTTVNWNYTDACPIIP